MRVEPAPQYRNGVILDEQFDFNNFPSSGPFQTPITVLWTLDSNNRYVSLLRKLQDRTEEKYFHIRCYSQFCFLKDTIDQK